jgi:single-stranded-DNA-specific exonuclease
VIRWILPPPEPGRDTLARALGISPITASILLRRGVSTEDAARRFLRASLDDLTDPLEIPGMEEATAILVEAIRRGSRTTIYGDYDTDGVCATAILVRGLRALGARVSAYIPHRLLEGYGLNPQAVRSIAQDGCELLVAVDCGITAREEIELSRSLGMRVVVVDHHEPPKTLPPADALVASRAYCAAGLSWLLLRSVQRALGCEMTDELVELAAIATVADVTPLLGDNRILTKQGLVRIPDSPLVGLRALVARVGLLDRITADDVAWRLAPRLNASGRLDSARRSLDLLLTDDPEEAEALAHELETLNRERQTVQDRVTSEALAAAQELREAVGIVLWGEWHPGVLGIAAGKVREAYYRPTILLSVAEGMARGSGRSIPGLDLVEVLRDCRDLLEEFGGHAAACGLVLRADHLDAFRERFDRAVRARLRDEDLYPSLVADAEVTLSDLDEHLADELEQLEPYGAGWPRPVLVVRGVQVEGQRLLGATGEHLWLSLSDGPHRVDAVAFGWGEAASSLAVLAPRVDVAATLERKNWPPQSGVRLLVQDLRLPDGTAASTAEQLLDHLEAHADAYASQEFVGLEDAPTVDVRVPTLSGVHVPGPGEPVRLRRNPDAPFDLVVESPDGVLGRLPPAVAGRIAPSMDRGMRYRATVLEAAPDAVRLQIVREAPEPPREPVREGGGPERLVLRGETLPEEAWGWIEATGRGKVAVLGGPGRGIWRALLVAIVRSACTGRPVVCVWPTHDLADARWGAWRDRIASCGLNPVRLHGVSCATGSGIPDAAVVVTTVPYLSCRPDLVPPDALLVGEGASLPEVALRHSGPVLWNLWRAREGVPSDWTCFAAPMVRTDLRVLDRRRSEPPVDEVIGSSDGVLVFEAGPRDAIRTARNLRARLPEATVAYDHDLLPVPIRNALHALLSQGRIRVLVCAGPPPREEGTSVPHAIWLAPQAEEVFLLQAASIRAGHKACTLYLAFGPRDTERALQSLERYHPSRRTLRAIYRALRDGGRPVGWPDPLWAEVLGPDLADTVPVAMGILEEAGLLARSGAGWEVRRPQEGRAELEGVGRFLEGEARRAALRAGARWLRDQSALEILEAVAGPAAPQAVGSLG